MYVELERESNPKEPIAGDEPPLPGARISVRSNTETTVYRNCWCLTVEDVDELERLAGRTPVEVLPPVHRGTDAFVRILDGPAHRSAASKAGA